MTEAHLSYRQVVGLPHIPGLLLSACLARLAARMFGLAIVLYVLEDFDSAALAGWVAFASIAPGLVFSPLAGALLDRVGESTAITVDMAVSAALLAALAAADWAGILNAPILLLLAATYSLTSPLSVAGIRALIPRLVPKHALDQANALDSGSYALTDVLGPFLAGPLFALVTANPAIIIIAGLYALAAVSLLPMTGRTPAPAGNRSASPRTILRESAVGVGYLLRHPTLRGLAISYSLYQASWGILVVAVPVGVARELGGSPAADSLTGVLWAVAGLAGGIGAILAGGLKVMGRERTFIAVGASITAITIFPIGALLGLIGLGTGLAVAGMLEGPVDVGVLTLRQRRTAPGRLGRVIAVSISLNMAGLPLGSAVGGLIVTWSLPAAFAIAAATSALSASAAWRLIPR